MDAVMVFDQLEEEGNCAQANRVDLDRGFCKRRATDVPTMLPSQTPARSDGQQTGADSEPKAKTKKVKQTQSRMQKRKR